MDFFVFFLFFGMLYTLPVSAAIWLARRRLSVRTAGGLLGLSFGLATAYNLWRVEWFDVWRHGVPHASYILSSYGPPIVVFGSIGGGIGAALVWRRARKSAT